MNVPARLHLFCPLHCKLFANRHFSGYRSGSKIQYPAKSIFPKVHLYDAETHNMYLKAMSDIKSKRRKGVSVFVENRSMIRDLMKLKHNPSHVFYVKEKILDQIPTLSESTVKVQVTEKQMSRLTDVNNHQGVMAVFNKPAVCLSNSNAIPLIVYLDRIRNSGNAGTIVRSAAGAACTSVITSEHTVDLWLPGAVRSAAAAHFLIPIHQKLHFSDVIAQLPEDWTVCFVESQGTIIPNKEPKLPYHEANFAQPTLMVFGSEGWGVSNKLRGIASKSHKVINVFIPHVPQLDSLNVSMAATILIFEMAKQYAALEKNQLHSSCQISLSEQNTVDNESCSTNGSIVRDLENLFPSSDQVHYDGNDLNSGLDQG